MPTIGIFLASGHAGQRRRRAADRVGAHEREGWPYRCVVTMSLLNPCKRRLAIPLVSCEALRNTSFSSFCLSFSCAKLLRQNCVWPVRHRRRTGHSHRQYLIVATDDCWSLIRPAPAGWGVTSRRSRRRGRHRKQGWPSWRHRRCCRRRCCRRKRERS